MAARHCVAHQPGSSVDVNDLRRADNQLPGAARCVLRRSRSRTLLACKFAFATVWTCARGLTDARIDSLSTLCAVIGAGQELFGHACANGGVILRPGETHKVMCGHGKDHGAYCGPFCPHIGSGDFDGAPCASAWAPQDAGAYIRRETYSYRRAPGYGRCEHPPSAHE